MQNEHLTFNDLPMVVGRLADEIAALRQKIDLLQENTRPVRQNTHIPMSVEEAAAYLRIPLNTLYAKLSAGTIPRHQARQALLPLSGRIRQVAREQPQESCTADRRGEQRRHP